MENIKNESGLGHSKYRTRYLTVNNSSLHLILGYQQNIYADLFRALDCIDNNMAGNDNEVIVMK